MRGRTCLRLAQTELEREISIPRVDTEICKAFAGKCKMDRMYKTSAVAMYKLVEK